MPTSNKPTETPRVLSNVELDAVSGAGLLEQVKMVAQAISTALRMKGPQT